MIFELNGKEIYDAKSFFIAAKLVLPMDPPLSGKVNWDAFSDSLWYGIDNLNQQKIAVLWKQADNMMNLEARNFQIAVECFEDVATSIVEESNEKNLKSDILIFLFGTSDDFKVLNISYDR
jgi:hypothetical protein